MAPSTGHDVRQVTLRFLTGFADLNMHGTVHGGTVMKWMDEAGYVCAAGWSGRPCVTVYVGGMRFYKPVLAGMVVEVHAQLIYTGRTSMHIAVNVRSRNPIDRQPAPTTHCVMVFVALDETGAPVVAPAWTPRTADDRVLQSYAQRLTVLGRQLEGEMRPYLDRMTPPE